MKIPENYVEAENTAAALLRGQSLSPLSYGEMYAVAQSIMGAYHGAGQLGNPTSLHEEDDARPLIAAARLLDAVAESQVVRALPADIIRRTRLLAANAFGMAGNLPSAAAVVRKIDLDELSSDAEFASVGITCPTLIPQLLAMDKVSGQLRTFFERLTLFLMTGADVVESNLRPLLEQMLLYARSPFDMALLANSRLVLSQVQHLSIAKALSLASDFMRAFGIGLFNAGRPCFLPPQKQILFNSRFGQTNANAVVTVPTSGGKTLLAEFAIAGALEPGPGVAIYVVPYIALGNQVHETLKRHFGNLARIHAFFGGFKAAEQLNSSLYREIIVATPERLDAVLRTQDLYRHLKVIVFDEAHIIENGTRGARIEALIARLRLQQMTGKNFRIVLLSAVLSDVEALCQWLGSDTINVSNNWRPTARRVAVWRTSGRLRWLYANDLLKPPAALPTDALAQSVLPWPRPMVPAEKYSYVQSQLPNAFANAAFLGRYLFDLLGGPILIVCGTKASTRSLAGTLADSLAPIEKLPHSILALIEIINRDHKHLSSLVKMLVKGVAYHNASLPTDVRKKVEEAIRLRDISFTCATTTLAEGVDLPFRTTILFDWLQGYDENQKPMASLLFRNIAGRCGRAGEFVEGDTVIFDNVLGSLKYTREDLREAAQNELLNAPPALKSTIGNNDLSPQERQAVDAVVSSQLLATIPEHPNIDRIEEHFAAALYSRFRHQDPYTSCRKARLELLDDRNGEPFARAASPMWLTEKGVAANMTGLSASSASLLLDFLSRLRPNLDVDHLSSELISTAGIISEQGNNTLAGLSAGTLKRSYMQLSDWKTLSAQWRNRTPFEDMFVALPKAAKSKASVSAEIWISGQAESDFVARQYDRFVEVLEYSFGMFVPWMLRACHYLAPISKNSSAESRNWLAEAEMYETARQTDLAAIELDSEAQS
ncbi:DEAD/DEAH box helicase [Rhizobium leguminosarum]